MLNSGLFKEQLSPWVSAELHPLPNYEKCQQSRHGAERAVGGGLWHVRLRLVKQNAERCGALMPQRAR